MEDSEPMASDTVNGTNSTKNDEWLADTDKLNAVKSLKEMVYGNCRLLYGCERYKFYDIVLCEDEQTKTFAAILIAYQNSHTKVLRREFGSCPLDALRHMIRCIHQDTAILFRKYDVGSQFKGQQGYTNKETGKFELLPFRKDERIAGPDDDASGLMSRYSDICEAIKKKNGLDDGPYKRLRRDESSDALVYED